MKILIITNLFPSSREPNRGIFNKQQFDELAKLCDVRVVAPVPCHKLTGLPPHEKSGSIDVYHPRYFMLPKIGRSLYGIFFFLGIFWTIRKIRRDFKFDAILATWAYPDGFASALISRVFKRKLYIKVHGSDINIAATHTIRRKMIVYAMNKAEKVITVTDDMKNKMADMGVNAGKITVLHNGIDTDLFKPQDRLACRKVLSLPAYRKIVLYVGNLERTKGPDILIDAMPAIRQDVLLAMVGAGSMKSSLERMAGELGLQQRIVFAGARPHSEIPLWMNSADVFCLPSRNEGCPNVILEALACGVPVVASKVGGIPEILNNGVLGDIIDAEDKNAISRALESAIDRPVDREAIRRTVYGRDWKVNAKKLFGSIAGQDKALNILYCHRTRGTGPEGVHITGIVKGLRELGNNVTVISPPGVDPEKTAGDNPYEKKKDRTLLSRVFGYATACLPQPLFEMLELAYNMHAMRSATPFIKAGRADLIYERHSFFSFAAAMLADKYGIPFIIEVNEIAGEKRVRGQCFVWLAKKIERYVFDIASSIIVVSSFLKEKLIEQGVDPVKIYVMSNAVDHARFMAKTSPVELKKKYGIREDSIVVGFIGWFVYWHNIELLIEAFDEASRKRNMCLCLVGDGVLKDKLLAMVRERHIGDRVIFPGPVPHEHIPDHIGLMDVCVIPDSNEYRSPIKMFEYMSMSKAVIAPKMAPIESVVNNGENGVLFAPKDRNALLKAISGLADDAVARERLGRSARETVMQNHTWLKNAEKVVNIYRRFNR